MEQGDILEAKLLDLAESIDGEKNTIAKLCCLQEKLSILLNKQRIQHEVQKFKTKRNLEFPSWLHEQNAFIENVSYDCCYKFGYERLSKCLTFTLYCGKVRLSVICEKKKCIDLVCEADGFCVIKDDVDAIKTIREHNGYNGCVFMYSVAQSEIGTFCTHSHGNLYTLDVQPTNYKMNPFVQDLLQNMQEWAKKLNIEFKK